MAQKRSTKELGANSGPPDQKELCKPKRALQKEPSFKRALLAWRCQAKPKRAFAWRARQKELFFRARQKDGKKKQKRYQKEKEHGTKRAWQCQALLKDCKKMAKRALSKEHGAPGSFQKRAKRGQKEKELGTKRAKIASLFELIE